MIESTGGLFMKLSNRPAFPDDAYREQERRERDGTLNAEENRGHPNAGVERNDEYAAITLTRKLLPDALARLLNAAAPGPNETPPQGTAAREEKPAANIERLILALQENFTATPGNPDHFRKVFKSLADPRITPVKPCRRNKAKEDPLSPSDWCLLFFGLVCQTFVSEALHLDEEASLTLDAVSAKAHTWVLLEIGLRCLPAVRKDRVFRRMRYKALQWAEDWLASNPVLADHLRLVVQEMARFFAVYGGLFRFDDSKPLRFIGSHPILPTDVWARFRQKAEPYMNPAHPMIVPPVDWAPGQRGGQLVRSKPLIRGVYPDNTVKTDWLALIAKTEMPVVFDAINILQRTPWRINRRVLKCMQDVFFFAPEKSLPQRLRNLRQEAEKGRSNSAGRQALRINPRSSKSTWKYLLADLVERPRFFFPYRLDYRGRAYPEAPWLSPQGDDFARALLEFAIGKPVTSDEARKFLARHGCDFVAKKRIAEDLGLLPEHPASGEDHYRWVCQQQAHILACADDPVANDWWIDVAKTGKHWQLLAFCFAWADALRGAPCHLPVYVDGSCNGLQHMAALLRDTELARRTNLLPSPRPEDTYLWIKKNVEDRIRSEQLDPDCPDKALAQWVLANELLDRDVAKAVVIRFSYGSVLFKDALFDHFSVNLFDSAFWRGDDPLQRALFDILYAQRDRPKREYARHLADASKEKKAMKVTAEDEGDESLHAVEDDADPMAEDDSGKKYLMPSLDELTLWHKLLATDSIGEADAVLRRKIRNYLLDQLAAYLGNHFGRTLRELLAQCFALRDTLAAYCRAIIQRTDLPVVWVTPVGLPVMQRKFKEQKKAIDSVVFGRLATLAGNDLPSDFARSRRQLSSKIVFNQPDGIKQRNAIAPNLIHSLDASHLMLTIVRSRQLDIECFAAIHDAFGTLAADMPHLAVALRDAFMHLHRVPLLEQLHRWFALLLDPSQPVPADLSPMQGELLGLWRRNWQGRDLDGQGLGTKTSAKRDDSPLPPPPPWKNPFDLDQVAHSDYLFS